MPITLNGTTGVVTPGATVGSITGVLKATSGVVEQAIIGTDYSDLTLATAQTASGTAVDFTGIPSWAKRITVMLNGVGTNGSSIPQVQLGVSGTPETSGYLSMATYVTTTINTTRGTTATSGFILHGSYASISSLLGSVVLTLLGSGTWTCIGTLYDSGGPGLNTISGSKTLAGTLNMLRITTVNGTDTFDAGTINISYE